MCWKAIDIYTLWLVSKSCMSWRMRQDQLAGTTRFGAGRGCQVMSRPCISLLPGPTISAGKWEEQHWKTTGDWCCNRWSDQTRVDGSIGSIGFNRLILKMGSPWLGNRFGEYVAYLSWDVAAMRTQIEIWPKYLRWRDDITSWMVGGNCGFWSPTQFKKCLDRRFKMYYTSLWCGKELNNLCRYIFMVFQLHHPYNPIYKHLFPLYSHKISLTPPYPIFLLVNPFKKAMKTHQVREI